MELITDCIHSTAEKINSLVESSRDITYATFEKHVGRATLELTFPNYAWSESGLKMKDDYAVSYHKGVYDGMPVYYCFHSLIEYIFG